MRNLIFRFCLLIALTSALGLSAVAQASAVMYRGGLKNGSAPATGVFDFQFDIDSLPIGGEPLAAKICAPKN